MLYNFVQFRLPKVGEIVYYDYYDIPTTAHINWKCFISPCHFIWRFAFKYRILKFVMHSRTNKGQDLSLINKVIPSASTKVHRKYYS